MAYYGQFESRVVDDCVVFSDSLDKYYKIFYVLFIFHILCFAVFLKTYFFLIFPLVEKKIGFYKHVASCSLLNMWLL